MNDFEKALQKALQELGIKTKTPHILQLQVEPAKIKGALLSVMQTIEPRREIVWLKEYDSIVRWLTNNRGKGLFLYGDIGTGKTLIMKSTLTLLRMWHRKIIKLISARDFSKENFALQYAIAIDDIGVENVHNEYGNKVDIIPEAIDFCESNNLLFFGTSNLTQEQLIERYGERTFDRIKELAEIIIFEGKSFR